VFAMLLIDCPRPHPITEHPLPSPPAWPACASPRPRGPGIRLESRFRECHLPPLMVLIIGMCLAGRKRRHRGGFSIKASARSAQQQARGRPEPILDRGDQQNPMMGWAAYLCLCLFYYCRPGTGGSLWTGDWVVNRVRGQIPERGWRAMRNPSVPSASQCPGICFPLISLPRTQNSQLLNRKISPWCPSASRQNLTGDQKSLPLALRNLAESIPSAATKPCWELYQ
jgi:hypothetical protein